MRGWKVAAVGAPLVALGGLAAALTWFSRRWIVPPRVIFEPPHEEHVEQVRFRTDDGVALHGWFMPGRPGWPAVILCHGYQRCMEEPFGLAVDLRERGFTVMLFDFRGCGRSDGRYTTIGHHEPRDLFAAVGWLRRRVGPDVPIGLYGISMGGSVAIEVAAHSPEVAAVVADSAFSHLSGAVEHRFSTLGTVDLLFHRATMVIAERLCDGRVADVRPVDAVGRVAPRPLLLIHGGRDDIVPLSQFEELCAKAGEPVEHWLLPGTTHAMARLDAPEAYLERVAGFFERALRRAPEAVAAG